MEKTFYNAPLTEVLDVRTEGTLLTGSTEAMKKVDGSWDNEENW